MAFKKKLHDFQPDAPEEIETQRTKRLVRNEPVTRVSVERDVRQLLADKVSGTCVGLWMLIPEHLRLGTWDLIKGWCNASDNDIAPRLAMQLVHEAAVCSTGVRRGRSLSQKGFEAANGLPFIATDATMHELLAGHTVQQAQQVQAALGKLRRTHGDYRGELLAIDPHHLRSYTQRQTRRHRHKEDEKAVKTVQTYFCLDADTCQPLGFTIGSAAVTTAQGAPDLLRLIAQVLDTKAKRPLVLADKEHFCMQLFETAQQFGVDLLVPKPLYEAEKREFAVLPHGSFTRHWAGLATATRPYCFRHNSNLSHLHQIIQRCGERPDDYLYTSFVTTVLGDAVQMLIRDFPRRWHIEEFFNAHQALGWKVAGTLNLNIRYGKMTMALIAQAVLQQLRARLDEQYSNWEAAHFADRFLLGLDGDMRVLDDTIIITYYNAPDAPMLRHTLENTPKKLESEGIDPRIPWLYDFKLDFRFK
jgi:hypothetical protein